MINAEPSCLLVAELMSPVDDDPGEDPQHLVLLGVDGLTQERARRDLLGPRPARRLGAALDEGPAGAGAVPGDRGGRWPAVPPSLAALPPAHPPHPRPHP